MNTYSTQSEKILFGNGHNPESHSYKIYNNVNTLFVMLLIKICILISYNFILST